MSPVFVFLLLLHTCHGLNEYGKEIGPNGEDIWRSVTDFIPLQSQSYGTIRLGQIMSVEFDFVWGGRTRKRNRGYECFFRVGFNASFGSNCDGEAARYPSFWLTDTSDTMHVSTSSGTFCQSGQSLTEYGVITIGTTYHVKISFNDTSVEVYVSEPENDRATWHKSWSRQPTQRHYIGDDLPVWFMSNKHDLPLYIPGNGTFFNILMKSSVFTSEPTRDPTEDPTTFAPSFAPTTRYPTTAIPTASSQMPTYIPTISPVLEDVPYDAANASTPGHITAIIVANVMVIVVLCIIIVGIVLLVKNKFITMHKASHDHSLYQNYHYNPNNRTDLECQMNVNRHAYVPTLTATETAHVVGNLRLGHEYVPTFTATETAMAAFTAEMQQELYGIQPRSVTPEQLKEATAANICLPYTGYLSVAQNNEYKLAAGRSVSNKNRDDNRDDDANIYKDFMHSADEREAILEKSTSGSRIFLEKDEDEEGSEYDTSDDDVVTSNKYANLEQAGLVGDGPVFTFKEVANAPPAAVDPNVAKSDFERQYVSTVQDSLNEITRYAQMSEEREITSPKAVVADISDMFNETADDKQDTNGQHDVYKYHPQSPYQYQYPPEQDVLLQQDEDDDNPSTDLDDIDVDSKHEESVDLDASSSGLGNVHVSIERKETVNMSASSGDSDKGATHRTVSEPEHDTISTTLSDVISINN